MYAPQAGRYDGRMNYVRCGKSGLKLPAISLGLWQNFGGVDVFANAEAMVHTAFDLGITHFDLANLYGPPPGSAEENFSRIFHRDLAAHRIFLPVHWPRGNSPANPLYDEIISIPVDARYGQYEMEAIATALDHSLSD